MPVHPGEALKSGGFNKVTLINGTTRDEGRFFAGFPENETGQPITVEGYPAALHAFFGAGLAPRVREEYSLQDYNSPGEAYAAAVTDYLFSCPALAVNRWASQVTAVYAYEFADRTAPSYLKRRPSRSAPRTRSNSLTCSPGSTAGLRASLWR